ncbi:response regulator [Candidatus Poribacteria bacterium]|nr:response regulator [Candidatus Poribacteria bacterium]
MAIKINKNMEKINILVLDSEISNINALARVLKSDYNIFPAQNGREAAEILVKNDIKLLITDYPMLSTKDAEFLASKLKLKPEVALIILTTCEEREILKEEISVGTVNSYITKPWEPENLRAVIARTIQFHNKRKTENNNNTNTEDEIEVLVENGHSSKYIALTLSLIYCGLGQIYKGEILKGVNLVFIYTLLIVSTFFYPAPQIQHLISFGILAVVWILGMIDAYIDREALIEKGHWLTWRKTTAITSVIVISAAVVTVLMMWAQPFTSGNNYSHNEKNPIIQDYSIEPQTTEPGGTITVKYTIKSSIESSLVLISSIRKSETNPWIGNPENPKIVNIPAGISQHTRNFTLSPTLKPGKYDIRWEIKARNLNKLYDQKQSLEILNIVDKKTEQKKEVITEPIFVKVGTFSKYSNAKKLQLRLKNIGYPAKLDPPDNPKARWHKVLVGGYPTESEARNIGESLLGIEGINKYEINPKS